MKHISFVLLTIFLIITCCSCSENPVQNGSEMNFPNINENTDSAVLVNAALDLQSEVSKNEPQTFTEDFDGIIMTVTTDKSKYQLDELIHVEATVKNTTDEKIHLYVPVLGPDSHQEISTSICGNNGSLIDIDTYMKCFAEAIDVVTINPNEDYVQSMVFATYTGYGQKLASTGLYSGKCTITLLSNPTNFSDGSNYTHYSLDFSLTLESSSNSEVSKNEPQTITKDFDGIIMTVTTDKSRYQLDELIHVEATVKNTTDEKISLICVDSDSYAKIRTRICSNIGIYLIDIDAFMKDFDDAINIVTINPNEEYTQNTVFETYTGVDTSSRRLAETGLCLGESTILVIPDPTDVSGNSNTSYSLAFTLILE